MKMKLWKKAREKERGRSDGWLVQNSLFFLSVVRSAGPNSDPFAFELRLRTGVIHIKDSLHLHSYKPIKLRHVGTVSDSSVDLLTHCAVSVKEGPQKRKLSPASRLIFVILHPHHYCYFIIFFFSTFLYLLNKKN